MGQTVRRDGRKWIRCNLPSDVNESKHFRINRVSYLLSVRKTEFRGALRDFWVAWLRARREGNRGLRGFQRVIERLLNYDTASSMLAVGGLPTERSPAFANLTGSMRVRHPFLAAFV